MINFPGVFLLIASFLQCCICDTTASESAILCNEFSFIPDPDDCHKYYFCAGGTPIRISCAPDLIWNAKINRCDEQENTQWDTLSNQPESKSNKPLMLTNHSNQSHEKYEMQKKTIIYFTDCARYRNGIRQFMPDDIDSNLCTHIIYAFAEFDAITQTIKFFDSCSDIDDRFVQQIIASKEKGIKVSIAVGGWKGWHDSEYGPLRMNSDLRRKFIQSAEDFVKRYNFDGLELNLEYSSCRQNSCDKKEFAELIIELSAVFRPQGLLLSAAISPHHLTVDDRYDIQIMSKHLDWINLIPYIYNENSDVRTQQHSERDSSLSNLYDDLNVEYEIDYWIEKGGAPENVVLGVPSHGWIFPLKNFKKSSVNARSYDAYNFDQFTKFPGALAFYEICAMAKHMGWKIACNPQNGTVPYAYKNDERMSFDGFDHMRAKGKMIFEKKLGGAMFWTLNFDDLHGRCECGKYPLITALVREMRGGVDAALMLNRT